MAASKSGSVFGRLDSTPRVRNYEIQNKPSEDIFCRSLPPLFKKLWCIFNLSYLLGTWTLSVPLNPICNLILGGSARDNQFTDFSGSSTLGPNDLFVLISLIHSVEGITIPISHASNSEIPFLKMPSRGYSQES